MQPLKFLGKRVRAEEGISLVVMMAVLALVMIMSATAVSASLTTKKATHDDRSAARAQAAAEAGLRVALFRLNQGATAVPNNKCPGTGAPQDPSPTPWSSASSTVLTCAAVTDAPGLGDGTSYTSFISTGVAVTTAGPNDRLACAGTDPLLNPARTMLTLSERCVTSTGTADGVTRRIQARIVSDRSTAQFPIPGMLGIDHICFGCNTQGGTVGSSPCVNKNPTSSGQNAVVEGVVGSNNAVTINTATWNGTPVGATNNDVLVPAADTCPLVFPGASPAHIVRTTSQWSLPDNRGLFEDPSSDSENPLTPRRTACQLTTESTDAAVCNDDAAIPLQSRCATFNAGTRALTLPNNCALTLPTGTYDFCALDLKPGSSIQPADAASSIRVLFDSPQRNIKGTTSPACTNTSGSNVFTFPSNVSFLSNAVDVRQAQLYVFGNPSNPSSSTFSFQNAANFRFLLKAPSSVVQIQNASGNSAPTLYGGLAAWALEMQNNLTFKWDPRVDEITTGAVPVFYRSAWMQCSAPTAPASPSSGCWNA